ncbi:MAG: WD40/YVTN/BNR-like repeat-containing protein, partial [Pyrinomonadaceae bacterium]
MFTKRNTGRASRRATAILLSLVLTILAGGTSLAQPAKGRGVARRAKAGAVASTRRGAKNTRLARVASKRGNPVVRGDRSERTDQPDEAMKQEVASRLPKGTTEIPVERYFAAKEQIRQMSRYSTADGQLLPSEAASGESDTATLARVEGVTLSADTGSTSGVLGTWQPLGPGNVGGRTRALIIDPVTPNTMYAAGVAGGVWKTTDAGANWSPLDDFMANIAVTCLAFQPGNSSVIYAGTGEGFFNADAVRGAGIFKSTDAGATWTRLASTTGTDFQFVNDVVVSNVNAQHVYAATRSGVWRSLDGGATWALILNVPTVAGSATGVRGATDLAIRTDQATDYVFAAAGTAFNPGEPASHIYRSTDAANAVVVPTGTTANAGSFTDVYSESGMGRTSLAIAPSNQNVIYAMADTSDAGNYNLGLLGVFRSISSGDVGSWTTQVRNNSVNKQDTLLLSNPVNAVLVECGFGATNQ